jgi:hypothetical protein
MANPSAVYLREVAPSQLAQSQLSQSQLALAELAAAFFRQSVGAWQSQRRYYTLKDGVIQEVVSQLQITFLPQESPELQKLALLHELEQADAISCGVLTTWDSSYVGPSPRPSKGTSVFGICGDLLYRDRGYSTAKPVIAKYTMRDAQTMALRTEYSGNTFEEELKLIGSQYRTRQTIISRAGEEQMIGQYLEKRL